MAGTQQTWRSIWKLIEEKSADGQLFRLVWVKGHTTTVDVLQGRISATKHEMNVLADRWAGRGAEAAKALSPTDDILERCQRIVPFYSLLAKLCGGGRWQEDYKKDRDKVETSAKPPQKDEWLVHPEASHEPWRRSDGSIVCALCQVATLAKAGPALKLMVRGRCRAAGGAARTGLKAEARRKMIEGKRGELRALGAMKLPTAAKISPTGPAPTPKSSIHRVLSALDVRAATSKPFLNCRVGLNVPAGCINILGSPGQQLRLLSGVRGGDHVFSLAGTRCHIERVASFTLPTPHAAAKLHGKLLEMAAMSAIPRLPPQAPRPARPPPDPPEQGGATCPLSRALWGWSYWWGGRARGGGRGGILFI